MPCCTNQSSVAKAWKEFDDNGRMKESEYRDRVVDVAEEFVKVRTPVVTLHVVGSCPSIALLLCTKFTAALTPISDELTNRFSERKEKEREGRLLTQAEKESKASSTS